MNIIFQDGFEIDFADNSAGLWTNFARAIENDSSVLIQYVSSHPRTGVGCVRVHSTNAIYYAYVSETLPSTYTELYLQFAFYFASTEPLSVGGTPTLVPLLTIRSSTSVRQITLGINETSQVLQIYRGGNNGTLLGSGAAALAANTIYLVELRVVISDTVGIVQARLNGNLEIDLSAQDTNNAGGGDIKSFELGVPWSGVSNSGASIDAFFDDVIIADGWTNGAGVHKRTPNADGFYSQWTSTGGAVDYTEVDDVASYGSLPDGATTALSHQTVGERTSVGLSDIAVVGTVLGVTLISNVKNSAAGADQMAQFIRLADVDADQPSFTPATTDGWRMDVVNLNSPTGPDFTALEIGWVVK